MDGDTLVLKNMDHLFLKPMLTAAVSCASSAPFFANNRGAAFSI